MAADERNLTIRRGQLKGTVTRFLTYLQSEELDPNQVSLRREKIEEVWHEFDQIQTALELTENLNESTAYRKEFEDLYFKAIVEANKIVSLGMVKETTSERGSMAIASERSTGRNSMAPQVKLAALKVPVFNGDYLEWASFYDTFTALVHTHPDLLPVSKFFHLREALSGEALNSIRSLETTANNYEKAWSILCARYNNKKVRIQAHVRAIFDLDALQSDSAIKLRYFFDALSGHMRALEALEQEPESWGPLLMHLISTKLDKKTLQEWEAGSPKDRIAEVSEIMQFLENRFKILEAIESAKNVHSSTRGAISNGSTGQGKSNKYNNQFSSLMISAGLKCYVCQLPHTIYKCPTLIALPIKERINKVTELKLCKICLRQHENKKCFAKYCFKCSKPHNTLLHLAQIKNAEQGNKNSTENAEESTSAASSSISAHTLVQNDEQVLLSTAVVHKHNASGENVECRILLDSGSQCNLITENMVQNIRLKRYQVQHTVMGIGGITQPVTRAVNVSITSRYNSFNLILTCLVVQKITHCMPNNEVENCVAPNDINLADPLFRRPQKIDLLLGNKHFFEIICAGQIKQHVAGPIFQETRFGWVVAGPVLRKSCKDTKNVSSVTHTTACVENDTHFENLVSKFWRIEKLETDPPLTLEEKMCRSHFDKTVQRDKTGRFIIRLPFKNTNNASALGKSYQIARRRWAATENRLRNNIPLREAYTQFMHEYEALGHMERVIEKEDEENKKSCYLPHHAVINENSTTTKVRVVFDASCKTESGNSLNDLLLKGPVLQDELLYILARFRTYNYVLSADITKMYRQIKVANEDCNYQRILWRADPKMPIQVYRLTTLTYGTVPAAFIATACLEKLAETGNDYLRARESIKRDFYMDDYLSGASTKEEAIRLKHEVLSILGQAGFELRKWSSNDPSIINSNMSVGDKGAGNDVRVFDCAITKILGLFWEPSDDVLRYKVSEYVENTEIINKRKILSEIATIFDPLGLVGPVVVVAKLFMQNLWQLRVNWDEQLPKDVSDEWLQYKKCLPRLNKLVIPRMIISKHKIINIQIHGFADASTKAYGACLYLRSTDEVGTHTVRLIFAKSKVAPLKTISLPRLELCAALLLARMQHRVIPKLRLEIERKYFWSDSTITLAWISSPSTRWKTFVAHRVGEIQDLSCTSEWSHVSTHDNPADLISRGCDASQIAAMELWWYGPKWLCLNKEDWPAKNEVLHHQLNGKNIPEKQNVIEFSGITTDTFSIFDKYSSLNKIIRITAYCVRFYNKIKEPKISECGVLTTTDLRNANLRLLIKVQKDHFEKELNELNSENGQVSSKSKFFRLRPFLDEEGLIRVGGRLKNALSLGIFQKHPILLPKESAYTNLLFQREHEQLLHGGPQAMLASIRLKYWPLNARNIARKTVYRCVKCFRMKPTVVQPIMGNLPRERVEIQSRAFQICGVDFAGPIMVKQSLRRNAPATKGVEACLNSRPLTALSSDPSDLLYITPAHFLIGDSLMSIPERDETNTQVNRLDRWRRVQQFSQILWKRWSREYLHQLQERSRWASEKGPKVDIGSVVLISEDNLPPLRWKIGRVREVTRGSDNIIRTAVVKTVDGELTRAVRKLCPLPFEGNDG
ncbi:unnamed protein product [Macrosiphum euphorbiae]|uniref:Endonuclease n=1 Tax=Macrosiphum euphorbiae TaxID=13131 RepID=A0AAV0WAA5_9HEMI|nr:unnamed protein product [Macrosiphum euphorbiae]